MATTANHQVVVNAVASFVERLTLLRGGWEPPCDCDPWAQCGPGGGARTARHDRGFNLGASAGRRDWRSSQLSLRRSFGLVYRGGRTCVGYGRAGGWCLGAVSEIQLRRPERVGWVPRTQARFYAGES